MKRPALSVNIALVAVFLLASTGAPAASRLGTQHQIVGRVLGMGASARGTDADPCPNRTLFAIKVRLRDAAGNTVAGQKSKSTGRFGFRAAPGSYSVTGIAVTGFLAPEPVVVVVRRNQTEPDHARLRFTAMAEPGVAGQVTQSPTCGGPQREGQECSAPLENAHLRVEDENGTIVAEATTGADGYYTFALDPGAYTLIADGFENQLPSPPPPVEFTVAVEDTGPHWRPLDYDTGIR